MISPRGRLPRWGGSGDVEIADAGSGGGISGIAEEDRFGRAGMILLRFRVEALLEGEAGSLGAMLASGSKICDGSMPSPVFALRPRALFLGDMSTFAVVCRRVVFRGPRFGAGVKSSSSSCATILNSSSESPTIAFLRAARRAGRLGDADAMLT